MHSPKSTGNSNFENIKSLRQYKYLYIECSCKNSRDVLLQGKFNGYSTSPLLLLLPISFSNTSMYVGTWAYTVNSHWHHNAVFVAFIVGLGWVGWLIIPPVKFYIQGRQYDSYGMKPKQNFKWKMLPRFVLSSLQFNFFGIKLSLSIV